MRTHLIILCSLLICPALNSHGQQILKVRRADFRITDEGFREAWKEVREGKKLVKAGPGSYREARHHLLEAYRYNPNNPELNYMIGITYLYTDDKFESIKYLKKSYTANPGVSDDIRLMLGRAYHQVLDFDNAILEYDEYLRSLPAKAASSAKPDIDRFKQECMNGKALVANPVRVVISNLGPLVNTAYDDYNSVLTSDETRMYITSRRQHTEKGRRSPFDTKYYENIYAADLLSDGWGEALRETNRLNLKGGKQNISALAISPDDNELYLYVGKQSNGDIYKSTLKKGKWGSPKALPRVINTKYRETSVCLSSDGNTLYFTSANPKTSLGGTDIFVVKRDAREKWGKPVNLGPVINSKYDETALSLSHNDSALYFSSKGHNSMGGYDVFMTRLSATGLWSVPENLGYPVNTPDDDLFYRHLKDGRSALYSANRENGLGALDIFRILFLGAEKTVYYADENQLIAGTAKPFENIFFTLPAKIEVDTSITMIGKITDKKSGKGVMAKLELIDTDVSRVIATTISDTSGNYRVKVPAPKQFGVEIIARDYMLALDVADLRGESSQRDAVRDFSVERIEVGATVILRNIFFEFGKATLKPESFTELENVIKFMTGNESVRLEISGHTDNVGSLKANTTLSENRAKAVVNYLISKGIQSTRLEYKGYAFTQPIAPNTSEAGRAQNRRVEFKVLSM